MGYAEAIEQQVMFSTVWGGLAGLRFIEEIIGDSPAKLSGISEGTAARRMQALLMDALVRADPFFVAGDIAALVHEAGRGLERRDTLPLAAQSFPTVAGFCWFERSLPLPAHLPQNDPRELIGILWNLMVVRGSRWFPAANSAEASHAHVFPLVSLLDDNGRKVPWIGSYLTLGFSDVLSRREVPGLNAARAWQMLSIGITLWEFLRQRILTTSVRPIPNRQARRRLARIIEHDPVVHVVELRARDYQQRDESQPHDVEYTCQWLVRGHWHQYHTKEGLQPRWVMPYVKGPSDKPLRVAEKVAYEVVR